MPAPPASLQKKPPGFKITVDYLTTAVSAWLVPGAGHFLLGHKVRGSILGATILGLFWAGQALARPPEGAENRQPMAVSRKVSPVFFACQVGNGLSTLASEHLWGQPHYGESPSQPIDRYLPRHLNLGILLTSLSGLLNLLVILHVLDPRTWIQAAAERESPPP